METELHIRPLPANERFISYFEYESTICLMHAFFLKNVYVIEVDMEENEYYDKNNECIILDIRSYLFFTFLNRKKKSLNNNST